MYVDRALVLTPAAIISDAKVWLSLRQKLRKAGIAQSMGSIGDCYDNAVCERFHATIEKELGKHEFIQRLLRAGADIVALQEVSVYAVAALRDSYGTSVIPSPVTEVKKMCALILGPRVKLVEQFALAPGVVPAPKETVCAKVSIDGAPLTAASFHVAPGSMYGREAKRMNFGRRPPYCSAKLRTRICIGL